jgi:enoyl-CoA hydratase/carnithine racemase
MESLVRHELDAPRGVARLILTRPAARNPTSIAMLDAMDESLDAILEHGEAVRIIHVVGEGKAFCAGLDLDEVQAGAAVVERLLTRLGAVMRRLRRIDPITIARVNGAAIGGGFGFMCACDFAITHPDARLGYPPLATGLSPALMAPWLVRKIGPSPARALVMQGGTITGDRAFDLGLATHLAELDALDAHLELLTDRLLAGGSVAMTEMKRFLNELDGTMDDASLDRAASVSARVIASDETQARLRELFGDRRPS